MKDLNCPYCDAELEVCHDDGENYGEDEKHQMECDQCEKSFVFTTYVSFSYYPEMADCLNGKECDFELTHTSPKTFAKMRCTTCAEERELTTEERSNLGIGSKEQYFKRLEK